MVTIYKSQILRRFRHYSLKGINVICNEAETDDEVDSLLNCDFVHAEMK